MSLGSRSDNRRRDRLHQTFQGVRLECLAQAADVHVHRALFDVSIAPQTRSSNCPRPEHPFGVCHEEMQQTVFGWSEGDLALAGAHAMTGVVELQALNLHHVGGAGRCGSPQHRLDTGQQFARARKAW